MENINTIVQKLYQKANASFTKGELKFYFENAAQDHEYFQNHLINTILPAADIGIDEFEIIMAEQDLLNNELINNTDLNEDHVKYNSMRPELFLEK